MSEPSAELEDYRRVHALEVDADALPEAARLAHAARDPLVRALAKAEEVLRARTLGRQQLAVVAGAELLERLEQLLAPGVPAAEPYQYRHLIGGLNCAIASALDLPEVRFEAIDALIDELERLLEVLERKPWAAWLKRARRYYTSGDQAQVVELSRALLPHINYTNGVREKLGCPACVLCSLVWFMGPELDPELAFETLRPVLENNQRYPNEDPEFFRVLLEHNPGLSCDSVDSCSMRYGRTLIYAGRCEEARAHVRRPDPYDGAEVFLLPMVVRLEHALAANERPEIELWVDELEARMVAHEDIDEAFQAALRVAQGVERLGGEDPERLASALAHARVCASRLDARLAAPHYADWLAKERSEGPPF